MIFNHSDGWKKTFISEGKCWVSVMRRKKRLKLYMSINAAVAVVAVPKVAVAVTVVLRVMAADAVIDEGK